MKNKLKRKMDKHYTVRVKDVTLEEQLDSTFKMVRDKYHYKNDFICDCLTLGVKEYLKKELKVNNKENDNDFLSEIHKNNEMLNEMGEYLYVQLKEIYKRICGILALSSTNEQLLIGLSEECPKLTELVNRGDYANTPKYIEDLMQEVADKIVEILK